MVSVITRSKKATCSSSRSTAITWTRRGSHICLRHPQAVRLNEALIEAGVIGDLRAPDRLRLGPAPITSRFTDVWDAADIIRRVAGGGEVTRSRRRPSEEIFPGGQP